MPSAILPERDSTTLPPVGTEDPATTDPMPGPTPTVQDTESRNVATSSLEAAPRDVLAASAVAAPVPPRSTGSVPLTMSPAAWVWTVAA